MLPGAAIPSRGGCAYNTRMVTRRDLFKRMPLAAALPARVLRARQLTSIGVQLYTVREVFPKKPGETLRAIEAMGYRGIEATSDAIDRVWPAVEASPLKHVSLHLDKAVLDQGRESDLGRALGQARQKGFSYAVFPYVAPDQRGGLDKFHSLVDKLNRAGEKCRALGLRFCYHNHAFEFEPMQGTSGFQIMMEGLDKNLCGFELDCFWVSVAGHDPAALIRQLAGRVPLVHLKDKAPGTPVMYRESVERSAFKEVGGGTIDWPAVLRAAASAGVEHYFVEQDQTPGDPLDSLRQSYAYLSKLQF